MKVICAPDSFKDSVSAIDAARAMREGVLRADPAAWVDCCPVADGGEGTAAVLAQALGGRLETVTVTGPLGDTVEAGYALIEGPGKPRLAVLDVASAAGLTLLPPSRRNAMRSSSYGAGELLRAALAAAPDELLIGVGGSATNDGGCGMAQALGVRFLDRSGNELRTPICGALLPSIARIDAAGLPAALGRIDLVAACDVDNPLFGEQGAARVYAKQKGASDPEVAALDAGLEHLAGVLRRATGVDLAGLPRAGAAGGLAGGLLALLGARLVSGIERVLNLVGLDARLRGADLCLTGEGRLDAQSLAGKACLGVARRAERAGVPAWALVGAAGPGAEAACSSGLSGYRLIGEGLAAAESMTRAAELLAGAAFALVHDLRRPPGAELSRAPPAP